MAANTWRNRSKETKCQFPNPSASTGVSYRKIGRSAFCWEAIATAREAFEQIGPEIKAYLEKHNNTTPNQVTWSIYMIGCTRETANPIIMFLCRDEVSRKMIRQTIEESGILKSYPGVRLGDASSPPDFDKPTPIIPFAGCSPEPHVDSAEPTLLICTDNIPLFSDNGNLIGKYLYAHPHLRGTLIRRATAGAILKSGPSYFVLTARHAFEVNHKLPDVDSDADSNFEYDIEEESESEDEVYMLNTTSRGSKTPEAIGRTSSNSTSTSTNESLDLFIQSAGSGGGGGNTVFDNIIQDTANTLQTIGNLLQCPDNNYNRCLDYSLVELHPGFLHNNPTFCIFNRIRSTSAHFDLHPEKLITKISQSTKVVTVTGSSGFIQGTISGTPTYSNLPGSKNIQELWTVRFEGNFSIGDCGSCVVDAANGNIFGHVIAGTPGSGSAYIIPTYLVVEDANARFGLNLKVSSRNEFVEGLLGVLAGPSLSQQIPSPIFSGNFKFNPSIFAEIRSEMG